MFAKMTLKSVFFAFVASIFTFFASIRKAVAQPWQDFKPKGTLPPPATWPQATEFEATAAAAWAVETMGWGICFFLILLWPWFVFGLIPGILVGKKREPKIEAGFIIPVAILLSLMAAALELGWLIVLAPIVCHIIPSIILLVRSRKRKVIDDDKEHNPEAGKFVYFGIPAFAFFAWHWFEAWRWVKIHPLAFILLLGAKLLILTIVWGRKASKENAATAHQQSA